MKLCLEFSLVVTASDSRPEGLGWMPDATKHPPSGIAYLLKNSSGRSPLTDGKMPCLLRSDWSRPISAESGRGKGLGRSENKRPETRS
ncbi:hypothetical protein TNCV_1851431 [Trichonephila clavipes]|nr:hypothetical protein TNCV_1851431 [Trichonephila clavipes]